MRCSPMWKNWRQPAVAAVAIVLAYIGANGLITNRAEHLTARQVADMRGEPAELVVANNRPVTFWMREMHWRGQGEIGSGHQAIMACSNNNAVIRS